MPEEIELVRCTGPAELIKDELHVHLRAIKTWLSEKYLAADSPLISEGEAQIVEEMKEDCNQDEEHSDRDLVSRISKDVHPDEEQVHCNHKVVKGVHDVYPLVIVVAGLKSTMQGEYQQ